MIHREKKKKPILLLKKRKKNEDLYEILSYRITALE